LDKEKGKKKKRFFGGRRKERRGIVALITKKIFGLTPENVMGFKSWRGERKAGIKQRKSIKKPTRNMKQSTQKELCR